MTMPQASTEELNEAANDPLAALSMATAMLAAIGRRNDFDSMDYMMRRESIAAAMHKLSRAATPDEPQDEDGNVTTVDITPESLKTPEGRQRVNAAMEAFTDTTVEVANLATQFVDTWQALVRSAAPETTDDLKDLRAAIKKRKRTQEEMLRSIANRN